MKKVFEKILPQKWVELIGSILKQKYAIAVAIFILWITFLDSNNLMNRAGAIRELGELQETKEYYKKKVVEDTRLLNELKRNNKVLERYAREQYLMKRENEEIFLIVEE